jgi:glyoxylase-like metal-dependent hydrolase (beta-lactamase superfamily II)
MMREFGTPDDVVQRAAAEQRMFREYAADAAVDQGLEDGQTVGPYTVYHVPGHSAKDILFVDHERRIAFTGDHVLPSVTPNSLLPRPKLGQARPKGLVQYCDSLRKTRSLDLDTCFPGHGGAIHDHRAVIDSLFKRVDGRNARVLNILGSQLLSVYEVARGLFPGADAAQMYLQLTAAVGHLDLLEEEGRVAPEYRDGVLCFRAL